ncbi:MAG TPA: HEAT repeat domain-containing protein [Acidimicrobiales bacterium]|nr:HEAT repeat domain-containing protein [Acidimicrobiales bacterium]
MDDRVGVAPRIDRLSPAPAGPVPEGDAAARRRDVVMAGHLGGDPAGGAAVARPALADPEPAVRAAALGALARLDRLELADVRRAARDRSPRVKVRAAELAWRFGPDSVPVLLDLVAKRQPEVVEAACFGLGELGATAAGHPGSVAALAGVARRHGDALCREAAVAAIGAIRADGPLAPPDQGAAEDPGRAAVLAALEDKPAVRRRAVLALAAFEGPDIDAALESALADRDWQVRQAAEDLTGRRPSTS